MSKNELTTTNGAAPQLAESMLRLLADSLVLGEDTVTWSPPAVPPETQKLRVAKLELERGLQAPTPKHMRWCCTKLSALPAKDGQSVTLAIYADNFIDACGHIPDDLWTAGTIELLKTKTFRPSPAEFLKAVERVFCERQRMLGRVNQMLAGNVKPPDAPFVVEPLDVRLRTLRDALKRIGRLDRAAPHERELAALEGRAAEPWAIPAEDRAEAGVLEPNTAQPAPMSTTAKRCAELAKARRDKLMAPSTDKTDGDYSEAIPEAAP